MAPLINHLTNKFVKIRYFRHFCARKVWHIGLHIISNITEGIRGLKIKLLRNEPKILTKNMSHYMSIGLLFLIRSWI